MLRAGKPCARSTAVPLKQRTLLQNFCSLHVRLLPRRAVRPSKPVVNTSARAQWSAARDAPVNRGEKAQPRCFVEIAGCSSHALHSRRPGVSTSAHKVHVGGHKRHEPGGLVIFTLLSHRACCRQHCIYQAQLPSGAFQHLGGLGKLLCPLQWHAGFHGAMAGFAHASASHLHDSK